MPQPPTDRWSEWLLQHRDGGDTRIADRVKTEVQTFVDRVLDFAQLTSHMRVADVGSGDGAVAFRAIERVGPSLRVILTDISAPLLRHAEAIAAERKVAAQCEFLHCSAVDLTSIDSASLDAVMTRAVLAYVPDKRAAFREFHRVLKPGGRLSLGEPVLQDEAFKVIALKAQLDAEPPGPHAADLALLLRWKAAQFPETIDKMLANPLTNYSERELVAMVVECGFVDVHLELHIDVAAGIPMSWPTFLATSPHPLAPTLGALLEESFTQEERQSIERIGRSEVETGSASSVSRVAYLSARKPT